MRKENFSVKEKLDNLEERLGVGFLRIHESYLIHTIFVSKYFSEKVEFVNGLVLPISRSKKETVKTAILKNFRMNKLNGI